MVHSTPLGVEFETIPNMIGFDHAEVGPANTSGVSNRQHYTNDNMRSFLINITTGPNNRSVTSMPIKSMD